MPDINIINNTPSLRCVTNEQLNFNFISKKSKKNDLSNLNQERLIKVITKLVSIIKYNNHFSENIIQDIELIKDAKNIYEIFSLIKDIEEKSEYIFQDTLDFSSDFSENKNLSDECIEVLIKLSNLGVFND